MGKKDIRCFIAVDISEEAIVELDRIQDQLKTSKGNVKWVNPGSTHLTLKFLGNVEEPRIPEIVEVIQKTAEQFTFFEIVLDKVGVFPTWRFPKVIWVGLRSNAEILSDIVESLEAGLKKTGFPKENRVFHPHLTLGRIKTSKNTDELERESGNLEINPIRSKISKIVLYESDLTPSGAVYTPLAISGLSEKIKNSPKNEKKSLF